MADLIELELGTALQMKQKPVMRGEVRAGVCVPKMRPDEKRGLGKREQSKAHR